MAKKKRLTKAQTAKRENIKWTIMFVMTVATISLYLAAFIEIDKTQATIDFNRKNIAQLNENLTFHCNLTIGLKKKCIFVAAHWEHFLFFLFGNGPMTMKK